MSRFHSEPSTKQPSAAQLSTPPPVACNLAETSLSLQVGGDGYSKNLAARRSRLAYRIRCRGSSGGPKLAIAAELSRSPDMRIRADLPSQREVQGGRTWFLSHQAWFKWTDNVSVLMLCIRYFLD